MSRASSSRQCKSCRRDPCAGNRRGCGLPPSAWMDVAVDRDLALAQRGRGSNESSAGLRPIKRWILDGTAAPACRPEASRRVRSCVRARQHAVNSAVTQPRRLALEATAAAALPGVAVTSTHGCVAELHETGALGIFLRTPRLQGLRPRSSSGARRARPHAQSPSTIFWGRMVW